MPGALFCFGFGYTARALAGRLAPAGWRIAATTRDPARLEDFANEGIDAVVWPEATFDPKSLADADAILVSTPPNEAGCPTLAAGADAIAARAGALSWVGYLSSNGVYGDFGGGYVDETTTPRPSTERGRRRLSAENAWRAFARAFGLPLVIFRLPGIYGPGRSAFDAIRAGRARRIVKDGQVFNRMHIDDIAAALEASLRAPTAGALFNLSDDEPAPPQDVVAYACALLGAAPPPETPFEEAALSPMTLSFYAENKRVRNERMKRLLGARLAHPTYREGLKAILDDERRR